MAQPIRKHVRHRPHVEPFGVTEQRADPGCTALEQHRRQRDRQQPEAAERQDDRQQRDSNRRERPALPPHRGDPGREVCLPVEAVARDAHQQHQIGGDQQDQRRERASQGKRGRAAGGTFEHAMATPAAQAAGANRRHLLNCRAVRAADQVGHAHLPLARTVESISGSRGSRDSLSASHPPRSADVGN